MFVVKCKKQCKKYALGPSPLLHWWYVKYNASYNLWVPHAHIHLHTSYTCALSPHLSWSSWSFPGMTSKSLGNTKMPKSYQFVLFSKILLKASKCLTPTSYLPYTKTKFLKISEKLVVFCWHKLSTNRHSSTNWLVTYCNTLWIWNLPSPRHRKYQPSRILPNRV